MAERPAEWDTPQLCRWCKGPVERVRWCFAIPVCYACLPPPEPLETITSASLSASTPTKGEG